MKRCGANIALVEDDPVVQEMLGLVFAGAGWSFASFASVAEFNAAWPEAHFDVLMLDWMLPDGTAESIIRRVRGQGSAVPILIESLKDDEALVVHALRLGADDYVVKPLRLSEVIARIEALIRRQQPGQSEQKLAATRLGALHVDTARGVLLKDGEPLELTRTEFELICYLIQHRGELLTRERLLSQVWGNESEPDTRTVDAHIGRLRKKLPLGPNQDAEIVTVHGYGYRLETGGTI